MVEQYIWLGRRWAGFVLAVMAGIVCLAPWAFAAKHDSVPDWVRNAVAQKLPSYPAETKAVVLLEDHTYTVGQDGRATEHVRRAVKILRPAGRDEGLVYVPFDNDAKILSLHVWSIGADGHEYAVKDNEATELGYPGQGNFYADYKLKAVQPPGREPGGIVAYEYEQRVRPYMREMTWVLQEDIPHASESFTLELPAGYTYRSVWAHHDAIPVAELEHQRWRWEMNDVPAVDLDHVAMRPSQLALAGRLTVHYAPPGSNISQIASWQGIGDWYRDLSKERLAATPEISAKAMELTVGKADFYDKTEAIAEFVQKDVRYFVIEMGIGGEQPHFASDIFHNRYGDCKDKATLLSSMLSTVGVHAALMMVDSRRGVIDPAAPSSFGNHMIAAIEIPKGYDSPRLHSVVTSKTGRRYLIFDPTSEKTVFGQLEHGLQGSFGVLVEGDNSQITELPVLEPELNTIHRTASFQLQPDGSLRGTVTERRYGDVSESARRLYLTGDAKEQREYLDHVLGQDFTTFQVSNVKVENADSLSKDLILTYTVSAEKFAKNVGPLLILRTRVMGSEYLQPDHKKRQVPINLRQTMQSRDEYDIELPPGYTVDELPGSVALDLGFAAYQSSTQVKGTSLRYSRTYTVRALTLPQEKYADVQRLAGIIASDEESRAILKKN